MKASLKERPFGRIAVYTGLGVLTMAAIWLAAFVPNADWSGTYDGVLQAIRQGRSPYSQASFLNPPWTVFLLAPFAALPSRLARGLVLVCTVAAWFYTAWRLGAPRVSVIAMLLSPTAIGTLLAGNLDGLILLGIFIPATWGLFVLLIKPQIGIGAAVYGLFEAWQRRRLPGVLLTLMPVLIGAAISAVVFPAWLDRVLQQPANAWNRSIFPYGIPLGMLLLWLSFRRQNMMFALASAPFFSPYLTFPTYLIVQIGLLHPDVERIIPRIWLQILLCVCLWMVMLQYKL